MIEISKPRLPALQRSHRTTCAGIVYCRSLALLVGLSAALVGCDSSAEQVRSYRVPKEKPPAAMPAANTTPPAVVASAVMHWDLPEGWRQEPNPNQMRFATLAVGAGDTRMEVSITELGGAAGGVLANVQRWRGQIGLPQASEAELREQTHPIKARGAEGVWVDLVGPQPEESEGVRFRTLAAIFPAAERTWFLKATGVSETLEPHRDAFVKLCESIRFAAPGRAAAPTTPPSGAEATAGGLHWGALPDGWKQDDKPRAMSVASFTISGDGREAVLTITPLGGSQDLLANINRWRRQVGLGPLADLSSDPPASIKIAGDEGRLVDIAGPQRRILGAIATRGSTTWFYKLSGPDPLAADQKAAFEAFVRSVRFDGDDSD